MKRRRLLLFLLGCVASITVAIVLWPREPEPEYNGVSLSEWLERYERGKHVMNASGIVGAPEAIDAIDHIGTNALPFLVRWIQYERPGWRQFLYDASWKLPHKVQYSPTFCRLITLGDKRHRADIASEGFVILRAKAEPATPELKRLAEKFPGNETSARAMSCLYLISHDLNNNPDELRSR